MATPDGSITVPRSINGYRVVGVHIVRDPDGTPRASVDVALLDSNGDYASSLSFANQPLDVIDAVLSPVASEAWFQSLTVAQRSAVAAAWATVTPQQKVALLQSRLLKFVRANEPTLGA